MRPIKFRAWNKNKLVMQHNPPFGLAEHTDNYFNNHDTFEFMQFTGLLDKNGKEIYEGDIIRHASIEKETGSVEWGYSEWIVNLPGWKEGLKSFGFPNDHGTPRIEVIGNIYENKELLNN